MRAHFPRCLSSTSTASPMSSTRACSTGRLPSFANTRSMRVAGGLGTVAARGRRRAGNLSPAALGGRRAAAHRDALQALSPRAAAADHRPIAFGTAVLIDCHSMPSISAARDDRPRADIVIGDRYGTSCAPAVTETRSRRCCARSAIRSSRNKPYAGGFITEHYGNPAARPACAAARAQPRALHGRAPLRARRGVRRLAADLETLADRLAGIPSEELRPYRAAAEYARPTKKGPPAKPRPKSREETPKEGGGNRTEARTALHKYAPAPHQMQVLLTHLSHSC